MASSLGCCVGKDCNARTCMALPAGETCSTCIHFARCAAIFGAKPDNTSCDFFPRRFRLPLAKVATTEVANG